MINNNTGRAFKKEYNEAQELFLKTTKTILTINKVEKNKCFFQSPPHEEYNFYHQNDAIGFPIYMAIPMLTQCIDNFSVNMTLLLQQNPEKTIDTVCNDLEQCHQYIKTFIPELCNNSAEYDMILHGLHRTSQKKRNILVCFLNLHSDDTIPVTLSEKQIKRIKTTLLQS